MAELSALAIFVEVVRCRSFSRAADRHGVSQSAASQRVSQLEKTLGVKLLDRSVRPPALTGPGRVFFEGCAELVRDYDALAERVRQAAASPEASRVRVAAIYSAGIAWLDRVRDGFTREHPGVDVAVSFGSPSDVREAVTRGDADIGIVSFPELLFEGSDAATGSKVAWVALRQEPMAVVCPVEHPWAREPSVSARHLGQVAGTPNNNTPTELDMIGFDAALPVGHAVRAYLAQHGVAPRITHSFDNLDTLRAAVLDTGRPAILPRRSVAAEVAAGRVSAVALRPPMARPIAAVYRVASNERNNAKPDAPPATLRPFLDFLAADATARPDLPRRPLQPAAATVAKVDAA